MQEFAFESIQGHVERAHNSIYTLTVQKAHAKFEQHINRGKWIWLLRMPRYHLSTLKNLGLRKDQASGTHSRTRMLVILGGNGQLRSVL